jgi:RNA polymerase sigma-70 factor, ECF subfamily
LTIFRDNPGLLERFRAGARPAMEAVYWFYVRRIEALVRHGFSLPGAAGAFRAKASEVEDLVQEVFARAFSERARLSFDGLRAYGPFLATLARNTVIDWGRRRGREVLVDGRNDDLADLTRADSTPEPVPGWADEDVAAIVSKYLAGLPKDLADLHHRRYVLAESQADAAAALGLSRQQLRTREARLRDGLADALKAGGKAVGEK